MWTKQYTPAGKVFYYNSTQNLSVWNPPMDSVVHEAPNLKTPAEIAEQLRNEEAFLSFTADTPQPVVIDSTLHSSMERSLGTGGPATGPCPFRAYHGC